MLSGLTGLVSEVRVRTWVCRRGLMATVPVLRAPILVGLSIAALRCRILVGGILLETRSRTGCIVILFSVVDCIQLYRPIFELRMLQKVPEP